MQYYVSPSYTSEKLENPTFDDLVDVFEDIWRKCILDQAKLLLQSPNGDIAAITLLGSYFEAIAGIMAGENTDNKSKEFFVKGFCEVFRTDSGALKIAATEVYKNIRCGTAHEGIIRHKVSYSRSGSKALFLTYPKNGDGSLNTNVPAASIMLSPYLFFNVVEHHFNTYIKLLREGKDTTLCDNFIKSTNRLWGIGSESNVIGMTEDEFLGRA